MDGAVGGKWELAGEEARSGGYGAAPAHRQHEGASFYEYIRRISVERLSGRDSLPEQAGLGT